MVLVVCVLDSVIELNMQLLLSQVLAFMVRDLSEQEELKLQIFELIVSH